MSVFKVASELGLTLELRDLEKLQEVLQGAYMQGVRSVTRNMEPVYQIENEEGMWSDVTETIFNESSQPGRVVYEQRN